jgi:exopolysaccharide production protein ExoZ
MKLEIIQIIRGYAALLVLLRHLTKFYSKDGRSLFGEFFINGFSGVDIFFVLSGFIISYTSMKYVEKANSFKFTEFYHYVKKRIIRIYPTYWIFLFLPLFILYFIYPNLNDYKPNSFLNILQTILLLFGHDKVSVISWTLSYEIFFYFMFGLLLLHRKLIYIVFPFFLMSFYTLFYFEQNTVYEPGSPLNIYNFKVLNYLLDPINLEFVLGIVVYYIYKRNFKFNPYYFIVTYFIFFIITNSLITPQLQSFLVFYRLFFFGIPAAILILGLLHLKIIINPLTTWFILLGDASYVLYLIHNSILSITYKFYLSKIENTLLTYVMILFLIIFICLLSILLYKKIESPIIKYLKN